MNRLLLIFLGVISLSNPASAITESQRERLDQFAQKFLEKKKSAAGYPVNQETSLDEFYAWYMKHGWYRVAMNNVGDPYKQSPYSLNSHEFEQEVVNYFARLYGFKEGDYWGFVTASGTDGNNHGIYFGRKYLESKSSVEPIIYVSEEAHYSIKKLADVQNTELRLIKATDMGQMDIGDFEKELDPARPALVVIAMGTTFKGAMDDQAAIRRILRAKHRAPVYIHSDAALFGGFLPYVNESRRRSSCISRPRNLTQSLFQGTNSLDSTNPWAYSSAHERRLAISIPSRCRTWLARFQPSPLPAVLLDHSNSGGRSTPPPWRFSGISPR